MNDCTCPMLRRLALCVTVALVCLVSPGLADAQEIDLPDLQLQRFRPAPGPTDYLSVFSSGVAPHMEWDASFYLDFADDPMQVATRNFPFKETVDFQTTLSLLGSIGLFDRAEIGILVPVTILQSSQQLQPIIRADEPPRSTDLALVAMNDTRISAKYQFFNLLRDPAGLGVVASLYVPLATDETLTSDDGFGGEFLVVGDYWLWRGIRIGANLGYRYRPTAEFIRDSTLGDELLWGIAANVPLFIGELDGIVEIDGAIGLAEDQGPEGIAKGEVPAEIKFAARYELSEDWTVTAGLGSGLSDGIGSPDLRAFVGIGGYWVSGGQFSFDYDADGFYGDIDRCPDQSEDLDGFEDDDGCPDPDNDGDGVPDAVDDCPNTPEGAVVKTNGCIDDDLDGDGIPNDKDECPEDVEDRDGFEDVDGCPDPDNDNDGIPDTADQCPDEAENINGFVDEDGCPDDPSERVTVTKDRIVITEQVQFETGSSTIRKQSYDLLDDVAQVLKANPQIELIRVEGHTDDRGGEAMNQRLSQARATSVRDYLIDQDIDADRLVAVGYGESQPIATNETAEGRQRNRRVEFKILETGDGDSGL